MRTKTFLFLAAAVLIRIPTAASSPALVAAIREGDATRLQQQLAEGANPNDADSSGATPLMHAAAYGAERDLRLLIDAGANVNHANAFGSTALMWAAGDAAKVRLLLERGAVANARAVDRTTALLAAARRGNVEAMRLLIARGASPNAVSSDRTSLLRAAYVPHQPAVAQLLEEHGVTLQAPDITPLMVATNVNDTAVIRRLLDRGVNPNLKSTTVTLSVPTVAFAASVGDAAVMRALTDRGADVNATATHGYTPLMMAAAAIKADVEVITFLIAAGADLHARDDAGRTALDWALLQGETAVVKALRAAGARQLAPPAAPPAAVARPRPVREAIEKALARLQPASPVFFDKTTCISCHQQSLPAMAVKLATNRGLAADGALAGHPTSVTVTMWRGQREQYLLGSFGPGFAPTVAYALMSMLEEGAPPGPETDAAVLLLASMQQPDGSWTMPPGAAGIRPPLDSGSPIHMTSLAIRALAGYMPPSRQAEKAARIERARAYLLQATSHDTQDEVFKLLGLVWSNAKRQEVAAQATRVGALQREDGGWAQLPTMKPDPYATGQALYALAVSGVAPSTPQYRSGAEFLLRTQLDDGTWFVQSRAFGFQPYFETGFPHGRSQFISSAGTAWAAIALALSL